MIVYLDASAIVKLYVAEAGSDQVRQWKITRGGKIERPGILARRSKTTVRETQGEQGHCRGSWLNEWKPTWA
jgi:predicted nucleic acid-binding protein